MGSVQDFVKAYYEAQTYLDDHDVEKATASYKELLGLYEDIKTEGTEQDKAVAHEQICKLYYKLQQPTRSVAPYFAAGLLVVLLSFVAVVQPSIVGLPIFPETIYQDVNVATSRTGFLNVTLEGIPTSIRLKGAGQGKVYLVQGKNLIKVWEGGPGYECVDSCVIDGIDTNKVVLLIEPKGGQLKLEKVKYTARPLPNHVPAWTGTKTTFAAPFSLNLSDLFQDEDGDDLVFLSSKQAGLVVSIENDMLSVSAEEPGERQITVYASDLKGVTRIPLTVTAE
ncbi:hypothetical protein CMO91_03800 [Candidatus Woesearchaeota archaeon]|jgi:hypothetical protein|nr:hypothetical protein [Candidatus Woesearchaeota archaeon]